MDPLGLFPDRGAIRMLITRLAQETKVYTVPRLRNTLGASPLSFSSEENPRTLSAQPCVRVIKGCPLLFSVSIL